MKKLFLKILTKFINFISRFPVKLERRKQTPLVDHIIDKPTINAQRVALAQSLREEGRLYHLASIQFISDNPGKTLDDFDQLPSEDKFLYIDKYAQA